MATTVYGNNVTSLWRSYVEYSTSETDSNYIITLTAKKRGYAVYSTTYSLGDEHANCEVRTTYTLDGGSAVTAESASKNTYGFDGYTSANDNSAYANNAVVITIPKTGATQSLVLAYSVTFPQGYTMYKNTDLDKYIDYTGTSYSSTASVSLTVPKAGSPSITSVDASRDDDTPTTVYVTPHVTSYDGDTFTISMVYGDETVELANETVNTITNMSEDPVTCTVTATGGGGTSAQYKFTVPAAFHTFLMGAEGKSVAFGKLPATTDECADHPQGYWECAMDAKFEGELNADNGIVCNGHSSAIGTFMSSSKSSIAVSAGIDTLATGASLTLDTGVWVVYGSWTFNSRSGSGSSNRQIEIDVRGSSNTRHRVMNAGKNFSILTAVTILNLGAETLVEIMGSCSDATQSSSYLDNSVIRAVRIA